MAFVGSYLLTGQNQPANAPNPEDAAGPVLDAIEAAGPDGADLGALAKRTGYDGNFLQAALLSLEKNGLAQKNQVDRYELTDFGAKARFLVPR